MANHPPARPGDGFAQRVALPDLTRLSTPTIIIAEPASCGVETGSDKISIARNRVTIGPRAPSNAVRSAPMRLMPSAIMNDGITVPVRASAAASR